MSVDPRIIASLITEDPDTFSEAGFNNSGVPYYAKSDTPAVRPRSVSGTPSGASGFYNTTAYNVSIKDARQEARRLMGAARTGDMVNMRVNIADNHPRNHAFFGPCTIERVSDRSVTLKPDNDATSVFGKPGRKMAIGWFEFLKLAKPID